MRRFLLVALCALAIVVGVGGAGFAKPTITITSPNPAGPFNTRTDTPDVVYTVTITGANENPTADQFKGLISFVYTRPTVRQAANVDPASDLKSVTGGAGTYTVTLDGTKTKGDGYIAIKVAGDSITDDDGDPATTDDGPADDTVSETFRVDSTAPECQVTADSQNKRKADPPDESSGILTFHAKIIDECALFEDAGSDQFTNLDVIVNGVLYRPGANNNATVLYAVFPSGRCAGPGVEVTKASDKEFTIKVYPQGDGPITVQVRQAAVKDDVDLNSVISNEVTVDFTDAPRVHIVPKPNVGNTNQPTVNYTFEFSKPVVKFGTGDVKLDPVSVPGTAGGTKTVIVTGSGEPLSGGSVFNVAISNMTYSGTIRVYLDGLECETPTVAPPLGNWQSNGACDIKTISYDGLAPTSLEVWPFGKAAQNPYTTDKIKIDLEGTAADDVMDGLVVIWENDRWPEGDLGGRHTGTEDASSGAWSKNGIYLRPGINHITVTARDAGGNTLSQVLTVNCTNTNWTDTVDLGVGDDMNPPNVGQDTSIALDASGNPAISYYDIFNGDLKYVSWDGIQWIVQIVDGGALSNTPGDTGRYSSLKLDALGNPHISYYDVTNGDLRYAYWQSGIWHYQSVDGYSAADDDVGRFTSIVLDSTGKPRIAYIDVKNGKLKLAEWTGSAWTKTVVDSVGSVGSYDSLSLSLALDATNNPRVSYYDATSHTLRYASRAGSTWTTSTVDSSADVGMFSSLALGATGTANAGRPRIAYYDFTGKNLKYAAWDGTAWAVSTAESAGEVGQYCSMALRTGDNPTIAYYDAINKDIKLAVGTGGVTPTWSLSVADDGKAEALVNTGSSGAYNVGAYSSMVLDSLGNPHMGYYDENVGALKYVFSATGPTCVVSSSQSLTKNSPVVFDIVFSTPVTGFAASNQTVTGGTVGVLTEVAPNDHTTYRLTVNPTIEGGLVSYYVPFGAARSIAGSLESMLSNTATVQYDAVRPAVTIDQDYVQLDPWRTSPGGPIRFTVVFSEPVTGFVGDDVVIGGSAGGSKAVSVTGNGTHYSVAVTGMTTAGSVTAFVPAGAAIDAAGNTSIASISTDASVWYDFTAPTCTINQAAGQSDPTNGGTINYTVVFSEPVIGFNSLSDVKINDPNDPVADASFLDNEGLSTKAVVITPVAPADAFGHYKTYNVAVSGMRTTGQVRLTVPAGAASDCSPSGTAINASIASTSTDNKVKYDAMPVTCFINLKPGQLTLTKDQPIRFDVVFGKDVTGFEFRDVELTGTANFSGATKTVTGSGKNYSVEISGVTVPSTTTSPVTVTANIPWGAAMDAAGNPSEQAVTTIGNTVSFDNAGPTVTVNQAADQPDSALVTPINFTVTFSEAVSDFSSSDVVVSGTAVNGQSPTITVTDATGIHKVFNVAIDNLDENQPGSVLVNVPAGAAGVGSAGAHDELGNANAASTSMDNSVVYFAEQRSTDVKTIPDNTVGGATSVKDLSWYSGFIKDVNIELTQISHGYVGDLTAYLEGPDGTQVLLFDKVGGNGTNFANTMLDDSAASSIVGSFAPFTGTFKPQGLLSAFNAKNIAGIWKLKIVDSHAGLTGQILQWKLLFTIEDKNAPTCAVSAPSNPSASPVNFKVAFSEPVIGFQASDITVNGGTADAPLRPDAINPADPAYMLPTDAGYWNTWIVPVTPAGDGSVECIVAAQAAHDTCGNYNVASARSSIIFRGTAPTVTINQASNQADPTAGPSIAFTAVFSKPVKAFTGTDVTLSGTAGATTATVTGSGTTYTVIVTGMTGSGTVTASIGAGVCTDLYDNPNKASTSTDNTVTRDVALPTVIVSRAAGQALDTTTQPMHFSVVFSKSVEDFTDTDVTAGGTAGGTRTVAVTGSGTTYDVAVGGVTTAGSVIVTVGANKAHDILGNGNAASTTVAVGDNVVWFDDGLQPACTINQAEDQADPTNAGPINFTAVFSKAVTGFSSADIELTGTAGATTILVTEVVSSAGSLDGSTYNVAVSDMAGSGTVIAAVRAGAAEDRAHRASLASTSTDNVVTFDEESPSVTINQASDQSDPVAAAAIYFTAVFSEPVTGFTAEDVVFSGAGATTATVTGSGTTYRVAISGMTTPGTVTASIPAGKAFDLAGNPSLASTSTDNTVTYEMPPTVTVNKAGSQASPTGTSPVHFTAVFSKTVLGFTSSDVVITGTAGGTTAVLSGTGPTYDIAVSGMTQSGTIIVNIPAGAVRDLSDNPNLASTSTNNTVAYDISKPTVTINQASGQADPTSASTINFTVVFSEPVTGFGAPDVALSGVAGAANVVVTGSGANYSVAVSGMTSSGTVIANVVAGGARDSLGNTNVASTSTDNTVTYDVAGPTVTINQAIGQADPSTQGDTVRFSVVFSKSVSDFATGDVTLSGTAGATTATVTGSGTTYAVAVTGMTGSGTVTASIAAGAAHDSLGNGNLPSSSTDNTVTYANSPLSVTVNQKSGQADPTKTGPANFTVVFSDDVTDFIGTDVTVTGTAVFGTRTVTVTGSGKTYNVAVGGMTETGTIIASVAAGVAHNSLGIANSASTSTDAQVSYDVTPPTISITKPTTETSCDWNTATFRCGGTASDSIALGSVAWTSAKGGSGTCTGTGSWSAKGIAIAGGHDTVTVTATDAAGNTATDSIVVDVVPAVPGDLWQGMAMVSLPIIPYDEDPQLEVGFFQQYWVMYKPDINDYVQYPNSLTWFNPAANTPGRGFWARFPDTPTVPYGMVPSQTAPATIHLMPGWNLIGQPFIGTVQWDLDAITVNDGYQTKSLADARSVGWVKDYAWGWEPNPDYNPSVPSSSRGEYYLVSDPSVISGAIGHLVPWRAYWLKADIECDLTMPAP